MERLQDIYVKYRERDDIGEIKADKTENNQ